MANVAIIGTQWGDEGKGKIVDSLSEAADVIIRFQGGHNAGHTIVVNGKTYKLSLLPSGILRNGKLCIIGNGVVLDPWALLLEISRLQKQGAQISPKNLLIAENVALILPLHQELDKIRELAAGKAKIGTTGRGIGPAYEDKVGRRSVRLADLRDYDALSDRVDSLLAHHNALRLGLKAGKIDKSVLITDLKKIAKRILPFSVPVWQVLGKAARSGKKFLFEGAQGSLLDVDFGTYPYVTSSSTVSGMASVGTGLGPNSINFVLGVVKAYTTRVGEGPFPSELFDEISVHLSEVGCEKGTVTGRDRRCGWFDAVLVRQTCAISGVKGVALTKLDVLDGLDSVKICVGYKIGDKEFDYLPAASSQQSAVEPIYEVLDGWKEPTKSVRNFKELPIECINYVKRIEELVGCTICIISTGPEREDIIVLKDLF